VSEFENQDTEKEAERLQIPGEQNRLDADRSSEVDSDPVELAAEQSRHSFLQRTGLDKVGLFIVSLFLFILALTLMKEGASALAPLIQGLFAVDNPANALGFGWIFAYLIMSGSPVAAAALTFFDAGILDEYSTFFMITGSRLGASFIVLFIGFIYVMRGRNRANSLGMGLLSLVVTGTTYLLALPVGILLLVTGALDQVQLSSGVLLSSIMSLIFTPLADLFMRFLPHWALFFVGLGFIITSFNLFDKAIPQVSLRDSQVGQLGQFVYRPWVMFGLGALITLISMSVSVSLAILVPLGQRGFVRRENVIPYIMGANVTTFIDTLLAAVLVDNPTVFTIVLVQMMSIAMISLLVLVLGFEQYQHSVLKFVQWIISSKIGLGLFMAFILVVPVLLLLLA
jgi:Na+/phosphate symporter